MGHPGVLAACRARHLHRHEGKGIMPIHRAQPTKNWWAKTDTPVYGDSRVTFLVDAHATMLTMCQHFLKAQSYIYIAAWGMTPRMQMVRGTDQRAGPDGSPEQEALRSELRIEGLEEAEIAFWCSHELTVQAVLGHMAQQKGVEVKVLIWSSSEFFSHSDPHAAAEQLTSVGVSCLLDDSAKGLRHHPIESIHQKTVVVDGTHAFVGGIDMLIELSGDYDRWDTHQHHYASPLRSNADNRSPHNWHDVHALIEGPAAADVERNFRQRWNDVAERHDQQAPEMTVPVHPLPPPQEQAGGLVQIARTIPTRTYQFAPDGITGIASLYKTAFGNAERFVYLENQYFWLYPYLTPFAVVVKLGLRRVESPEMRRNISKLAEALRRGARLAIVLPDHPNVGRVFTDAGLQRLREEAPDAAAEGRIRAFCLATGAEIDGAVVYRPIYVHAKVAIVDDQWATVGSANLNNRGMRDDTEMNVAVLDGELAHDLRLLLWAEHLGLITEDSMLTVSRHLGHQRQARSQDGQAVELLRLLQELLGDPQAGLRLMINCAEGNLDRFKARQPLVGHLLPYLTAEEARQEGLPVDEQQGWIEGAQSGT
jgi:phosphatidylserine/phosphatidylglycerophosphate/cardiolipin synthase-like enzyme